MTKYKIKKAWKSALPMWVTDKIGHKNYKSLLKGNPVELDNPNKQIKQFLDEMPSTKSKSNKKK